MTFRVSSDIGGTFTDLFVFDEQTGDYNVFKSSTTPDNVAKGMVDALRLASEHYKMSLKEFLAGCTSFIHGSTVAINAIVQGKVGKVGLICTRGFRDILTLREKGRDNPWETYLDYPEPYIPRYLTLPVTERINAEGGVEVPLDEDDVRAAVRLLKKYNVEAIAVCLLWSVANPAHEQKVAKIAQEEWPGALTVLSSDLNPIIREYRRTSSTVIDASLFKLVHDYIINLETTLRGNGYSKPLSLTTSSGGIIGPGEMVKKPIWSIGSGPAMGPIAGRAIAARERGSSNVLVVDMGGTSFDVSSITDGRITVTREATINGHAVGISMVDARSIGAGGGSIAWVDPGGLLHVGPESAGAVPGPACFGRGGTRPTVSDANLILGYTDPDYFLGGRMKLDARLSEEVIDRLVARPLGVDVPQAASAIVAAINYNMLGAMRDLTIWQGVDPREYLLVAGGSASGVHIAAIAKELGMQEVIIPKFAGVLCAFGGIFGDVVGEFSVSRFIESNHFDFDVANNLLSALEKQAEEFLARHHVSPSDRTIEFYVEARYPSQVWELDVPLRNSRIRSEQELRQVIDDFHNVHETAFAVKEPGQYIECLGWRARAIGRVHKPELKEQPYGGEDPSPALRGKRKAYFREMGGFVETPIYDGDKLKHGNKIDGPAIVEEPITTIVVPPGSKARVTKLGNYLVEL